jgi:hypothetical protein
MTVLAHLPYQTDGSVPIGGLFFSRWCSWFLVHVIP